MNLTHLLALSYYKTIATIDEAHKVYLVQHQETGTFYVKKTLEAYSLDVYRDLKENPVPGIPQIYECCEDEGKLIVIEEYISGTTLEAKISQSSSGSEPLTEEQIGRYMISLCEILERLHNHKPPLIHRDLKPSNIIITNLDNVVLLDFNAAKFYSGQKKKDSDTVLMGTQGYAAPEQYGFRESSPQTDLYSAGRILQECVAALPYECHTFDKVIDKCLQMEPSKRYASAGALRAALMRCLGQNDRPDISGTVVNPYFPPGFRTLNPWKMIIAAVVYFLVFDLCLTLRIDNMDPAVLPVIRVGCLIIALVNIAIGTNYLGVQKLFPYLRSHAGKRNSFPRTAGVILTMVVVTLILFAIMVFSVQAIYGAGKTGFSG